MKCVEANFNVADIFTKHFVRYCSQFVILWMWQLQLRRLDMIWKQTIRDMIYATFMPMHQRVRYLSGRDYLLLMGRCNCNTVNRGNFATTVVTLPLMIHAFKCSKPGKMREWHNDFNGRIHWNWSRCVICTIRRVSFYY